jgi:3-hydroxybutyryl-CoA dehydrogenase
MSRTYRVAVQRHGESRSFPEGDARFQAGPDEQAEVLILAGENAGTALSSGAVKAEGRVAVLVELGTECLGVHAGESRGAEGSNVLGFNRFRLGEQPPSNLVELVRQPGTTAEAIEAAQTALQAAGLTTAVVNDFPGRIIDRLFRPYLNEALRALDEQLATADDLDLTVRLGLGYPVGPIALAESTGLAAHADVSQALYDALGDPSLLPARRAQVARAQRRAVER